MRDRLLTQHFLQRFLENDLLSPDADRHGAIAMVCGGLLSILAAAAFSPLAVGRNTQLDLPSAFDAPAQGTTRLDLG